MSGKRREGRQRPLVVEGGRREEGKMWRVTRGCGSWQYSLCERVIKGEHKVSFFFYCSTQSIHSRSVFLYLYLKKKGSKRCTIESHWISDNRLSIRILSAYRFRRYPRVTCTSSHAGIDRLYFTICFSEYWCRYGQSDTWLMLTVNVDFFRDTIDSCSSKILILFLSNDMLFYLTVLLDNDKFISLRRLYYTLLHWFIFLTTIFSF